MQVVDDAVPLFCTLSPDRCTEQLNMYYRLGDALCWRRAWAGGFERVLMPQCVQSQVLVQCMFPRRIFNAPPCASMAQCMRGCAQLCLQDLGRGHESKGAQSLSCVRVLIAWFRVGRTAICVSWVITLCEKVRSDVNMSPFSKSVQGWLDSAGLDPPVNCNMLCWCTCGGEVHHGPT